MNDFTGDVTKTGLISVIEENLFAFLSAFDHWPRAEFHDETGIMWAMTDVPFPLFNNIMRARLEPERIEETIQSIVSQAKTRNIPLLWWTGPATQPHDLGSHLEKHGFVPEEEAPGMAVELDKLKEDLPVLAGLTVQPVEDDDTLKQWCRIFAAGFEMPDFVAEAFHDFMRHMDTETMRPYLGRLKGRPVATSLLTFAAGVAGIYNVTTLPDVRRQGIGAAMTLVPLREARNRGYRVGILHASQMGAAVYRSLGFREYCNIRYYVRLPEQRGNNG